MSNITTNESIPVIDLSATRKQRFRVAGVGDDNGVIELNTSDLATVTRLSETLPKLKELDSRVSDLQKLKADTDEEELIKLGVELKSIDASMREYIDYIFDSNVCEICAPDGSMYDPFGGMMRWEHIVDNLSTLYEDNLSKEMKKIKTRSKAHTAKYTGKR